MSNFEKRPWTFEKNIENHTQSIMLSFAFLRRKFCYDIFFIYIYQKDLGVFLLLYIYKNG
jgi:hypothetical protein